MVFYSAVALKICFPMLQGKKVLIIDDDIILGQSTRLLFQREGAEVFVAVDGHEGLQTFYQEKPHLVVLDIMLPDIDGYQVCRQIRLMANTPVIMLTTLNQDEAVVQGLDAGADDFISKPFSASVLLARARAVLRRDEFPKKETPLLYQDEYLLVDVSKRQVTLAGKLIKLSSREMDLLVYLVENAGLVLSYQQILDRIWGWEYRDNVDYVHVYISQLRRKVERDPKNPVYIQTEYGVGYRFEKTVNTPQMETAVKTP